jgi:hypothetical protein
MAQGKAFFYFNPQTVSLETISGAALVNSALARLEDCHWIRGKEIGPSKAGGRPKIHYEIHPAILAKRATK